MKRVLKLESGPPRELGLPREGALVSLVSPCGRAFGGHGPLTIGDSPAALRWHVWCYTSPFSAPWDPVQVAAMAWTSSNPVTLRS